MMAFMVVGKPWLAVTMSEPVLPDDLTLREFQYPQDYSNVIDLWKRSGPGIHVRRSDEPEELKKKIQRDPDLFLIAEHNSQVIGSVLGAFDGRRGMVYHLAVLESYRKRGIGTLLMNELETRMKAKGCIRSYLLVTHDNLEAIRFYENMGWEQMDLAVFGKDLE
jgi:ribosomal protein S18 acetylase RimI-like enzyme